MKVDYYPVLKIDPEFKSLMHPLSEKEFLSLRESLLEGKAAYSIAAWNDYLMPLVILTSSENYTLPIILNSLSGQFKTGYDLLMAGSLVSIVPLLVVYIVFQRYFASGLQVGGIKG